MMVAHVGNLCNAAFNNCLALRALGVEADLFITYLNEDMDGKPIIPPTENPQKAGQICDWPEWVRTWRLRPKSKPFLEQRRLLRKYYLIHGYTLSPVFLQFAGKRTISHCTGSDLRETAVSSGMMGRLLRRAYKRSSALLYTDCDAWTLEAIEKLSFGNFRFIHTIVNLGIYHPGEEQELRTKLLRPGEEKLIFAPARQDWHSKGNDVFLQAFSSFALHHPEVRLIARDWGEDAGRAKSLTRELGIAEKVLFVGELDPEEMAKYYRVADVVVGFFIDGESGYPHFPLIIQESLACGKPTVTYCDSRLCQHIFDDQHPYWRVEGKEEIQTQLEMALAGGEEVENRIRLGLAWAENRLSAKKIGQVLSGIYQEIINS